MSQITSQQAGAKFSTRLKERLEYIFPISQILDSSNVRNAGKHMTEPTTFALIADATQRLASSHAIYDRGIQPDKRDKIS